MKSSSFPDLNSLRIFVEVARAASFTAAAKKLSLPASTVSRRLLELENLMGATLLLRSTRRVSLTDAGDKLLGTLEAPFAQIEQGVTGFQADTDTAHGRICVATSISFATIFLPSILKRYRHLCPNVQVDVQSSHQNIDLVGESVDVALRMGEPADSDLIYRQFGSVEQHLYARPELVKDTSLKSPQDLHTISLITHRTRMRRDRIHWSLSDGAETVMLDEFPAIAVDDPTVVHGLVCEGLGVGLLNGKLAAEAVSAGRIVRVLPDWKGPSVPLYYLYHQQLGGSLKLQRFLQAIRDAT